MMELFSQLLEAALFNINDGQNFVLVPPLEAATDSTEAMRQIITSFSIPDGLFPDNCRICRLPDGEAFLKAIPETLPQERPIRVFIVPPFLSRGELSDTLKARYPSTDFWAIVLNHVLELVSTDSEIGMLLPGSFLFSEASLRTRDKLREIYTLRLVLEHNHSVEVFGIDAHTQFRMASVFLGRSGEGDMPTRFFKCPPTVGQAQGAEVLSDFGKLLKQGGGKTKHGYVLREVLPPGASWLYDAHHPDLVRRKEDLEELGNMRVLSDLVNIQNVIPEAMHDNLLIDSADKRLVAVVEGKDINPDGTLKCVEPRRRELVADDRLLKPGDICIRAIQGGESRLTCAVVDEDFAPATASSAVIVLRPRADLTEQDREFLLAYLRSSAFNDFLKARGPGVKIVPSKLLELPVPVADEALRLAVESLGKATRQFRSWAEELDAARGSLFDSQSVKNARITALSSGRLAKQRYEAAMLVSDFRQRVRTRFPYPMAFRWRTVEAQHPDLEGYIQVLECAEVTATYLAVVALLLARSVRKPVSWLDEMSKRIATEGHGTNMGDWVSILQEVGGSRFANDIPETAPFVEVSRFQNDPKVRSSLQHLHGLRNDQSHGRGPKGADVPKLFENALNELVTLLQAVEFLTDYPLREVETTRRDTLRKVTRYDFRELMGDHALVPVSHAETPDPEIEAASLYLVDRTGRLHLLRPLLVGRECPTCHSWSTFFLDTRLKGQPGVVMKSMEHGHPIEDLELLEPMRAWGIKI